MSINLKLIRNSFLFVLLAIASCFTDYDVNTADTKANINGLKRHCKVQISNDISKVYYYADEFGADVIYQLSFKCDQPTIDKIIHSLSLKVAPSEFNGLDPRDDLGWWNSKSLNNRSHWVHIVQNAYYKELWYSKKDNIAFYIEYSL
jgi:hypothetical protein